MYKCEEYEKLRIMRAYNLTCLALVLLVAAIAPIAGADSASSREYQVKAAFLYNFIQFVDWPEEKLSDSDESIIICIIGKDPFKDAFEPIKNKKVKDRSVVIKRIKSFEELKNSAEGNRGGSDRTTEELTKCHLLFICSSEKKNLKEIIDTVNTHGVLTVGEMDGFLEAGGIINWFVEDKKVRFEINVSAAERARLEIRSKLLRLAKRIVEEDASKDKGAELLGNIEANYACSAKYNNKI